MFAPGAALASSSSQTGSSPGPTSLFSGPNIIIKSNFSQSSRDLNKFRTKFSGPEKVKFRTKRKIFKGMNVWPHCCCEKRASANRKENWMSRFRPHITCLPALKSQPCERIKHIEQLDTASNCHFHAPKRNFSCPRKRYI